MKLRDLQALIDAVPNPVFLLSDGLTVLGFNAAAGNLWMNGSAPGLVGRQITELLADGGEASGAAFLQNLGAVAAQHGSLRLRTASGDAVVLCEARRVGAVDRRGRLTIGAGKPGAPLILLHCRTGCDAALEQEVARRTHQLTEANERLAAAIARRHPVEEVLPQIQKMEALGQLTGGVAHDFNNLLTVIVGNLELLEERTDEPRLLKIVRASRRAADRGERLTQQLLAFSRRQMLQPRAVDLNRLVRHMLPLLRSTVGGGNELTAVLAPDLAPCLGDPNQIEIVLLNLVLNARDAMPGGGRVTITTENCRRDDSTPGAAQPSRSGDYVAIAVSDTGIGIAPEVLDRVFEPFFTTKPVGEGSGLGLSHAYGFAKQSGGDVTLRSKVGAGTTVTLYLPRAEKP